MAVCAWLHGNLLPFCGSTASNAVRMLATSGPRPVLVSKGKVNSFSRNNVQRVRAQQQQHPHQQERIAWDKLSREDIDSWDDEGGPVTPLLDTVNFPVHLKNFSSPQLKQLCKELRSDVVHSVSKTGGHLSSSLGVVELSVALHYVFNAPEDKIIWDVGHQCYIHKILTGRRNKMKTIRQTNGLSGTHTTPAGDGHASCSFQSHSAELWGTRCSCIF